MENRTDGQMKSKPDIAEIQAVYEQHIPVIANLYSSIKQLKDMALAEKGGK